MTRLLLLLAPLAAAADLAPRRGLTKPGGSGESAETALTTKCLEAYKRVGRAPLGVTVNVSAVGGNQVSFRVPIVETELGEPDWQRFVRNEAIWSQVAHFTVRPRYSFLEQLDETAVCRIQMVYDQGEAEVRIPAPPASVPLSDAHKRDWMSTVCKVLAHEVGHVAVYAAMSLVMQERLVGLKCSDFKEALDVLHSARITRQDDFDYCPPDAQGTQACPMVSSVNAIGGYYEMGEITFDVSFEL